MRPSATKLRIIARNSWMPAGSSPLVGSSRIRSSGSASSARATPSRCRIPCEYRFARSSARSASPTRASAPSILPCAGLAGGGDDAQVLAAREICVEARLLDDRADARERGGCARPAWAAETHTLPDVVSVSPSIIRIVVVLPAPFGPRYPNAEPRGTRSSTSSTAVRPPSAW